MSFFAPLKFQPPNEKPPAPTDDTLFLWDYKQMTVGVISFGGNPDQKTLIAKAEELNELLAASGMKYDQNNWFYAGYDPPFRVKRRHNEIWIEIWDTETHLALTYMGQLRENYGGWVLRAGSMMGMLAAIAMLCQYIMGRQ